MRKRGASNIPADLVTKLYARLKRTARFAYSQSMDGMLHCVLITLGIMDSVVKFVYLEYEPLLSRDSRTLIDCAEFARKLITRSDLR